MNRNGKTVFRPMATAILGVLFLLFGPALLMAQDQPADPMVLDEALGEASMPNVGEHGAAILGRLDSALAEARRYEGMLTTASAEDSLVLRLQIEATRDEFMSILGELAELVIATRDSEDHRELQERARTVYGAVTPRIWELIAEMRTRIDEVRARRTEIPPAGRSALEDEMDLLTQRLDRYFIYGWDHIRNMESFGLDTASARAVLAGLLVERADELSGRISLGSLRGNKLGSRLRETPGDADLTALRTAAQKNLQINTRSQGVVLDRMDAMGMPTEVYRAQLVAITQDLASGLMDAKVAVTLLRQGWNAVRNWVTIKGPAFLVKILLFLFIVVAGRFLARLVSIAVERSLKRANLNMSFLLKRMIVTFSKNAIIILALVFGLAQLGLSLGPLLAGFGVIGFILGFAMQDSLSNLAAGMMILVNRPYDVGDLVEISGAFGKVEQMSMVSTSILTLDNQKLVVPNSRIWGDVIKNVTDQRVRRVDMTFGISYTDDIPHAEKVLNEILEKSDMVLNKPEPMVRLHTLNESSVDFIVRPWVKTDDYWDVYWEVTRAVKMRFDEEDISIPFPQRDVHVYEEKKFGQD